MKQLTYSREVHVWSSTDRAVGLPPIIHGAMHAPKTEDVTARLHDWFVHEFQANDAVEGLASFFGGLHGEGRGRRSGGAVPEAREGGARVKLFVVKISTHAAGGSMQRSESSIAREKKS